MHYAFISVLVAVSFFDIVFHQSLGIAPMALLYVALKLQADRAAEIFLKYGLVKPAAAATEKSWMPPPESDPFASRPQGPRLVAPESAKAESESIKAEQAKAEQASTDKARADKAKTEYAKTERRKTEPKPTPAPRQASEPARPKAPFRAPKFHGAPHEVLGVEADANTNMIVKAFRHWIKEFHPDHCKPGQHMRRATDRARTITSAKESLLDRRRQMRKAA